MDFYKDPTNKSAKRNPESTHYNEESIPFNSLYRPTMNDKSEQRRPKANCQNNLLSYFCEFCDNTSIHGFKFLGERGGRYIIEKVWWFIIVLLAFSGSSTLIYNSYKKWITAPVIVSLSTKEMPISDIPFPAVTICPELKVDTNVFNYSDVFYRILFNKNITEEENKMFSFLHMVCDDLGVDVIEDVGFDAINETIKDDDLFWYTLTLAEVNAIDCKWRGKSRKCDEITSITYTAEGKCVSFNMLDPEDVFVNPGEQYQKNESRTHIKKWSLENGYPRDAGIDTFPLRTILAGSKSGFQVDMNVKDDQLDYGCGELQGFKVTLHHPAEDPDMDRHFRLPLDEAVFVAVRPIIIKSGDDIQSYPPEKRHCYLPEEKKLSAYKMYTQQNCMAECLSNYTRKLCGCVRYDMADYGNGDICNLRHKSCMEKAKSLFLEKDINPALIEDSDNENTKMIKQCNCFPPCYSITFEAETSQTKYHWDKTFNAIVREQDDTSSTSEGDHYSKLIVYYKDMQFMTSERHELYGTIDFLANCGGLLGLFCGFSFTSFMEILYYLTLRLICNLKKFGRRVWSGDSKLM